MKFGIIERFPVQGALLALCALALANCGGAFYKKSLLVEDDRVAIYALPGDDYPADDELRSEMPPMVEYPKLNEEKLVDILGNLSYERTSLWGRRKSRVFYEEEVRHLAHSLAQVLENAQTGERLVIISRYDPDKSVLSRMERVTVLFWPDEEGINVVLGEIREEIPQDETMSDSNTWKQILPVSLTRHYPDIALQKSNDYRIKKIKGYFHETWAVFDPSRIADLKYRPLTADREKAEPTVKLTPVERLRRLKQAYEEGLISEKEYNEKRAEIVGEL